MEGSGKKIENAKKKERVCVDQAEILLDNNIFFSAFK